MIVLGLTGGIGMGKTTVAQEFAAKGIPVCNADKIVHELLSEGGAAAKAVGEAFPQAVGEKGIDKNKLGNLIFSAPGKRKRLEAILHPLVKEAEESFLAKQRAAGKKVAVLEIPLLFETGAEGRCDKVIVVSSPPDLQKERALARPGMTEEKLNAILAAQMPDAEKKARADFIIDTGTDLPHMRAQVASIVALYDT